MSNCVGVHLWMFAVRMAQGKKPFVILLVCNLIDLGCLPEGKRSNRGWAGCEGSPLMTLVLLRQQDAEMCSRVSRGQLRTFWAVFLTLCTAFLSSAVEPVY